MRRNSQVLCTSPILEFNFLSSINFKPLDSSEESCVEEGVEVDFEGDYPLTQVSERAPIHRTPEGKETKPILW